MFRVIEYLINYIPGRQMTQVRQYISVSMHIMLPYAMPCSLYCTAQTRAACLTPWNVATVCPHACMHAWDSLKQQRTKLTLYAGARSRAAGGGGELCPALCVRVHSCAAGFVDSAAFPLARHAPFPLPASPCSVSGPHHCCFRVWYSTPIPDCLLKVLDRSITSNTWFERIRGFKQSHVTAISSKLLSQGHSFPTINKLIGIFRHLMLQNTS
jgi:hypothetical protein